MDDVAKLLVQLQKEAHIMPCLQMDDVAKLINNFTWYNIYLPHQQTVRVGTGISATSSTTNCWLRTL